MASVEECELLLVLAQDAVGVVGEGLPAGVGGVGELVVIVGHTVEHVPVVLKLIIICGLFLILFVQ